MIVVMAGLPGTGKSTLARHLAEHLHAVVLDKDRLRPALFTAAEVTYTRAQDDFCVKVMLDTAAFILDADPERTVILDGRTCTRGYQVRQVQQLADMLQQSLRIIECVCGDATARRRLHADHADGRHPARNRTYALYEHLQSAADPITEPKLVVDTTVEPVAVSLAICLRHLAGDHGVTRP